MLMLTPDHVQKLKEQARHILDKNIRKIGALHFAVPNALLYPAAWGWDTPFIALGIHHYNPKLSVQLLEDFLTYQWPDGMIPQIVFPQIADNEKLGEGQYFPPPHAWYYTGTDIPDYSQISLEDVATNPAFQHTKGKTTTITQYPVWGLLIEYMQQIQPIPKDSLRRLVHALDRYHDFFLTHRDPLNLGLCAEYHPWIGCDNAPCYDIPMKRVYDRATDADLANIKAQRLDIKKVAALGEKANVRPTDKDYACFMLLVQSLARLNAKKGASAGHDIHDLDFALYSPMLNAILIRSDMALHALAKTLGEDKIAQKSYDRSRALSRSMEKHLWNKEAQKFLYLDALTNETYNTAFLGHYFPLLDSHLTPKIKGVLNGQLRDVLEQRNGLGFPSTLPSNPQAIPEKQGFDPVCYWRGPIWLNINALLLAHLSDEKLARKAKEELLQLVDKEGFFEYFNAESGEGCGANNFGWTASLTLFWLNELF